MQRYVGRLAVLVGATMSARHLLRRRLIYDFKGKVVLITGGSRGLGLVLARLFSAEGAKVAICARNQIELSRAQAELERHGATALAIPCDVGDREAAQRLVGEVESALGPIDVLVNNAGVIQAGPVSEMTLEDFDESMRAHFYGPLYLTMAVLPQMRRRRTGRIVNISSIGGKVAVPHLAPYCASKFALTGLSETLRAELMRDGVRVTTVCPGLMRTGSPVNAEFKGRHRAEYALFVLGDSLPPLAMSAKRAARAIVEACRRGKPELVLTLAAKSAVRFAALMPNTFQRITSTANRMLPGPGGVGKARVKGGASETWLTRTPLTWLTRRAALVNNEVAAPAGA